MGPPGESGQLARSHSPGKAVRSQRVAVQPRQPNTCKGKVCHRSRTYWTAAEQGTNASTRHVRMHNHQNRSLVPKNGSNWKSFRAINVQLQLRDGTFSGRWHVNLMLRGAPSPAQASPVPFKLEDDDS